MALLRLADHVVFDVADGTGVLLDTLQGVYFGLNPTATLLLSTALRLDTQDEVVADLLRRVDASGGTLRAGIEQLTMQLRHQRLIQSPEGCA